MTSLSRISLISYLIIAIALGGFAVWSWQTKVSGAVIASGTLVVESNVKAIQHAEGGIVEKIFVRDGDLVKAGDPLIRLDATLITANLQIVLNQLDRLHGQLARLVAERDDQDDLGTSRQIAKISDDARADILKSQTALLKARRTNIDNHQRQLEEQIKQHKEEIIGLEAQQQAKKEERDILNDDIEVLEGLRDKGLATQSRINDMRRGKVKLDGEIGQAKAAIARTRGAISEREIIILQTRDEYLSSVLEQIEAAQSELKGLSEQKTALEDTLKRIELRSPIAGYVHQLDVHTIGAVIAAGARVATIVPQKDPLIVEARISPIDIDQIHAEQPVRIRFASFNQKTTPELQGHIRTISADLAQDPITNSFYYKARINFDANELDKLGGLSLIPGMPVDSFITTADRTVLSFLTKPLTDQIMRAFREE